MSETIFETNLDLDLIHRGKVRDIYRVDDDHMLIVATDRISAFDVVLPTPIINKGAVLNQVSNFWFNRTRHQLKNHCSDLPLAEIIGTDEAVRLKNHACVVKKMDALPIESIVRGYIIGSGWKDYQNTGYICGVKIRPEMQLAEQFDGAIYTPSTKANVGDHDENVDFDYTIKLLGGDLAKQVRQVSLDLYTDAAKYALKKGIIIADTKFEFGTDKAGDLVLIDEVLTPDSSRFWDADSYQKGTNPTSFDKQYVRDYLETLDWDKKAPAPELPKEVTDNTVKKYQEALQKITQ